MDRRAIVVGGVTCAVLLSAIACSPLSPTVVTHDIRVPLAAERFADVGIAVTTADVRLSGAAADLVEGSATYPASDGKPETSTSSRESTAGGVAAFAVSQGPVSPASGKRLIDLRLNGGLPLDLNVTNGSGNSDLDLTLVDVQELKVNADSGNASVKLTGPHPSLSHASFAFGSGTASITANGEYPALEGFEVDSGSGAVSIDLSGTWRKSFTARVRAKSGNVTLTLPRGANIAVRGSVASGKVAEPGFARSRMPTDRPGAVFLRRAADNPSDFTLGIEVDLGSGTLTLRVPEKT